MKSERVIRVLCLLASVLFAGMGCAAGSDGTDGLYSLVDSTKEPAGKNCKAGGQRIDTGEDTNGNGKLDSDEILKTSYICDGTDGSDGTDGTNGTNGGNGSNGTDGKDALLALVKVTPEAPGSHCAEGGQRVDTGIDSNGNSALDKGEIDNTKYVCNGMLAADGLNSLIEVTDEPVGVNCQNGGQRIDAGLDANGNAALDPGEVDATGYVCNGGCATDADCYGALWSCDPVSKQCRNTLTMYSLGTAEWPDEACNPTYPFGYCDSTAQADGDIWADAVCKNNGWTSGVWTGNTIPGCGSGAVLNDPSISMWCEGQDPCYQTTESSCQPSDQTVVEFTCSM